jgi:hypothetical protein
LFHGVKLSIAGPVAALTERFKVSIIRESGPAA